MAGLFKNTKPIPVKDTFTGKVYPSKTQAGKVLAEQFDLDSTDFYDTLNLSQGVVLLNP